MPRAEEIRRDLSRHVEAFCREWFPNGRKVGNYWQMGDHKGAPGRSLWVRLNESGGREPGLWADEATGLHGDLLDLIKFNTTASSFRDVKLEALNWLGQPEVRTVPRRQAAATAVQTSDKAEAGAKLFSYGQSFRKTPVERYLRARGISRFGTALRYHSKVFFRDENEELRQLPAMLAAITDNEGQVTGCARTFLDTARDRVANIEEPKRVLGQLHGNAVRFRGSAEDLLAGEGVESVLSIGTVFPLLSLAACLTANHLGLFIPPAGIKRLWIARDNDEAGEQGAAALRERAEPMGIEVYDLPPIRNDFNDDLREDGPQALRFRLTSIMRELAPEMFASLKPPVMSAY